MRKSGLVLAACASALFVAGCHTDMWVQPKVRAQHKSDFFADGMTSRPVVRGTVARGHLKDDDAFFTGRTNGKLIEDIPAQQAMKQLKLTTYKEFLNKGKERFTVYCSPCHGQLGNGKGMIAQRGLALRREPGNYHTDRLRKMPVGHFYDVMTNGHGVMFSYASRVEPAERWAIAAYIRVLQLSQNARPEDVAGTEIKDAAPVGGAR